MGDEYTERDAAAIDGVLAAVRAVWVSHPTWRLGQLIVCATNPPDMCPTLFGMREESLVRCIQAFGRQLDNPSPLTIPPPTPATPL